ncbi:hypothetical protein ACVWZA_000566 [Sphingomonas sp. UYAg733]
MFESRRLDAREVSEELLHLLVGGYARAMPGTTASRMATTSSLSSSSGSSAT